MSKALFEFIGNIIPTLGAFGRGLVAVSCALFVLTVAMSSTSSAQTRSLKLYYLHTGEKATIIYKRNGKFIKSGLKKVNYFLRDWRRNEPTKMDPRLLDLIWEVYRETGSKAYVHIISGYRSPKTNNMLRRRGRGVAKNSQHTLGKAMDFFLPDVKLAKLRKVGLIKQVGGVGYYPTSGSPFVHLDTGRVRHWPRMSRKQLVRIFPKGRTLHVPSDRKPLKGFKIAQANYKKYKRGSGKIVISNEKELPKKKKWSLFARADKAEADSDEAANTIPAPKPVKTTVATPVVTASLQNQGEPDAQEEVQIAQLPLHGPIPTLAPRLQTAPTAVEPAEIQDNQIVVAALSPEQAGIVERMQFDNPVPAKSEIASNAEPVDPDDTRPDAVVLQPTEIVENTKPEIPDLQQGADTVLASIGADGLPQEQVALVTDEDINDTSQTLIPIPQVRPQSDPSAQSGFLLALADPSEPDAGTGNPLGSGDPTGVPQLVETDKPVPSFKVAALSPSEIEDLRKEFDRTVLTTNAQSEASSTLVRSLRPSAQVPQLDPTDIDAKPQPIFPEPVPWEPTSEVVKEATPDITLAALEPIEPGTKFNNQIATPEAKPNREQLLATQLAAPQARPETISENIVVAGLDESLTAAVPIRNPRAAILRNTVDTPVTTLASLVENTSDTTKPVKELPGRKVSLSHFSMANLEDNVVGKWALIRHASIREIAEIRPPAYGRNAIRELPSIILTEGFTRTSNGRSPDRFSGSSVEFLAFAKYEK